MTAILIANIFGVISSILKITQGYVKTKKMALIIGILQRCVAIVTCLILGSYTGAVNCALTTIGNILAMKNKLYMRYKIICAAIFAVVTVILNTDGIFGWLPFILFSVYMFVQLDMKNMTKFKISEILCTITWCVHDIYYKAFTNVIFNIIAIISNMIGMIRLRYDMKNKSDAITVK